jgi:aspartyl protease family protein
MSIVRAVVILLFLVAGALPTVDPVQAQENVAEKEWEALSAILERLNVSLPMNSVARAAVMKSLEELSRERCDQDAIVNLANALQKGGYRRDAATAHIKFSETCNGHAPSLSAAVNLLLTLSDYPQAATVATKLIELEPFHDNGYYLRALAYDRGDQPKKAIDDYVTAIELFGDKSKIASVG